MIKLIKETKKDVFALIGNPVSHSASSYMHNAAFDKLGIGAVYLTLKVEPGDLKKAIEGAKALGIKGLNVTIPYKQKCMRYLDGIDKYAKKIGAVNTILNKRKKLIGYNTDAEGFIDSLVKDAKLNPEGKKVFILGSGGAARAVSFGLCRNKIKTMVLVDVKDDKARRLKKSLKQYYPNCEIDSILHKDKKVIKKAIALSDIFINATGIGLKPTDPVVINPEFLHRGLLVCDLIYNPPMSRLLREAEKRKIKTLNGKGMLLYQGIRAFKIWTHIEPPEDVMRKSLKTFLNHGF